MRTPIKDGTYKLELTTRFAENRQYIAYYCREGDVWYKQDEWDSPPIGKGYEIEPHDDKKKWQIESCKMIAAPLPTRKNKKRKKKPAKIPLPSKLKALPPVPAPSWVVKVVKQGVPMVLARGVWTAAEGHTYCDIIKCCAILLNNISSQSGEYIEDIVKELRFRMKISEPK